MCTSLEFNELFGSSFDVPCFVFSSFVVQFSRYRLLPLFATDYLVYHTQFRLSRGFLNFFQVSFRHFRPLKVTISCFFLHTPCLPCLSGTGSLAELYYITTFFPFCQPLFTLFSPFFPFFPLFLPFLFDVSSFLSLFSRFFGVLWVFVGRDGYGAMIRGLLTSELFWKKKARAKCCPDRGKLPAYQEVPERETFLRSFCFCKKNQKAAGTPSCDLGSKLYGKIFFVAFPAFVPKPVYGTTRFFGCFNRCERVIVVQTQDWCFSKTGCRTTSSLRRMYPKRVAARYLCWVRIQNCCALLDRFNG